MINRIVLPAVLLAMHLTSSPLVARESGYELLHGIHVPDCIRKRCCDDYCPKPPPCPVKVEQFCCDDYCPKPLPCPVKAGKFCCDDYCPKAFPCIICPSCAELKCPPTLASPVAEQLERGHSTRARPPLRPLDR